MNSVHILDMAERRWYTPCVSGSAPPPRDCHSACLLNDVMVVIGGGGPAMGDASGQIFGDVWVYHPALSTWQEIAVCPQFSTRPCPSIYLLFQTIAELLLQCRLACGAAWAAGVSDSFLFCNISMSASHSIAIFINIPHMCHGCRWSETRGCQPGVATSACLPQTDLACWCTGGLAPLTARYAMTPGTHVSPLQRPPQLRCAIKFYAI